MRAFAHYKVSIGHTIWDKNCGSLLDLEHTQNWNTATAWTQVAECMVEMTDRHAYHGTIVAWCGWQNPVILRQIAPLPRF